MTPTILAHFDGQSCVPDEPVVGLAPGDKLRVTIERESTETPPPRRSLRGPAKGTFIVSDDFDEPLDCFTVYR